MILRACSEIDLLNGNNINDIKSCEFFDMFLMKIIIIIIYYNISWCWIINSIYYVNIIDFYVLDAWSLSVSVFMYGKYNNSNILCKYIKYAKGKV